jgi:hypothetical protein
MSSVELSSVELSSVELSSVELSSVELSSVEHLRGRLGLTCQHGGFHGAGDGYGGMLGWYVRAAEALDQEVAAGRVDVEDARVVRAEIHDALTGRR